LDKELSLLSADAAFEGKEALAEQAAVALEEAQSLYTRALEFEHKGEPEKALKCFRRIETFTTDYPALNEDISRMTQALELLGGWTEPAPESKQRSRPEPKPKTTREETSADTDKAPPASAPDPEKPAGRTFFDDQEAQKSRLVPYALGIIVVLVGTAIGLNYYFSSSKFSQAEERFEQCRTSLSANQFSEAELQCESALGLVKQVALFKSSARDALVMDIEKTLRSQPLKEGLAGNLLLDGEYYPKQVVANITAFREFKNSGDELFAAQKFQESVSNYEQALAIAEDEKAIDRQEIFQISENIKIAGFQIIYQSGISFIDRKKWVLATSDLSEALELLRTLSIPDKAALIDTIAARLADIEQATEKEKGDTAFAENRWSEASTHFRNALAMAMQSPRPDEDEIYELKQLVVKGDLYGIVSAGKSAFRQALWDEAISNYDKAINLLEDNRELLKQANTEENRKKLARIMLQASLIRDKQDAARHLKEHQYDEAITKLNALISSVSASEFSTEEEFDSVRLEAQQSIDEARENKLLADKISYLEDNFEELFTRHYSGSPPESLVEREVVFERKMGSKLLFRLQCVEVGRGRPLQLVMKYTHDLNSGAWNFYSDSQ
jgi:tetratricopeptide (TPR) repeat protein